MKILICYDESDSAQDALKVGIEQAKAFNGRIYLIRSLVGGTNKSVEENKIAENSLDAAKALVKKENIECDTRLLVKGLTPGEDTVIFAKENQIDIIVIGITKTSKVGKLVFGSTAQFVILEAPCPVLTVRHH